VKNSVKILCYMCVLSFETPGKFGVRRLCKLKIKREKLKK